MKLGITGASGQMGMGLVRHALARCSAGDLVAITRSAAKLEAFAAQGVEVREGDFGKPEQLVEAFQGIERLVMIPTGDLTPGVRIRQHTDAISAAAKAGVRHFTYISTASARPDPTNALFDSHYTTERALIDSGMEWTLLRMSVYADSLVNAAKQAAQSGTYSAVPSAPAAYVTRDDIAAAAAGILTSAGHTGVTYHATGPASLTQPQVAEEIGKALGKPVQFAEMTSDAQRAGLAAMGLPPGLVDGIAGFQAILRSGAFDIVTGDIERLSGKPAESVFEFLKRSLAGC